MCVQNYKIIIYGGNPSMDNRVLAVKNEVKRAIIGKDDVIDKVMTAIIAGGHILLEDIPGVGKTTMALAFSKAMGIKLSKKKTPEILKLVMTASEDAHIAADEAQAYFKRTKPFVLFHEQSMKGPGHVDTFKDKQNSYPSGHATRGWAYALVLSDVAPDNAEALNKCASDFAMDRAIMGRHWMSDIEAGKTLATAVITKVRDTVDYQKQLVKACAEYEAIVEKKK